MRRLGLLLLVLLWASPGQAGSWGEISAPFPAASPQSIGSPAAGCLAGARPLAPAGTGWQVLRPQRNRFWAHPETLSVIARLGAAMAAEGHGRLLVGDLSQPRGGPMAYGHGSHQSGLDADIWFRLALQPLTAEELAQPEPRSMVQDGAIDPAAWGEGQRRLLELAAGIEAVERMFVHPAIKQALCDALPPERRQWLGKLRPWWGHDEHVHLRLSCPPGSPDCTAAAPPPPGDGCGDELRSWIERPAPPAGKAAPRPLPPQCGKLLP